MITDIVANVLTLVCFNLRINAKRWNGLKSRLATTKSVSRKRKFEFTTKARVEELKKIKMKDSSESKVNWAVTAYIDWRNARLYNYEYDVGIYEADLTRLDILTAENLQHSLCYFVPEVTKVKGEGPYPGATLYQMIVAIQKYLHVNKIFWSLVDGPEFNDLKIVLDNVIQERTKMNIGVTKRQALVISYETEQHLWDNNILGEDTPDKLRNTVLFLIGINVLLRAVEEHHQLRRPMPFQKSQLNFEHNGSGVKCLVYREDSVTKTHNGGLNDMRQERKVVWVYPSENVIRCPVRLVAKYLSLCPPGYIKKPNFYLKSLAKPTPKQWYGCQVVGTNSIAKAVKGMMKEAEIKGFFTNHLLRRTGGMRLFQAGVQRKLVKEATGHRSDAVDSYQITSDEQRQSLSKIIAGGASSTVSVNPENVVETEPQVIKEVNVVSDGPSTNKICTCGINDKNIGDVIGNIVSSVKSKGKTVIKLEIEINHD